MQSLLSQEPIGLLIAAARRRIKQVVGARVRPFGLSAPQFWVLVGLAERRGASLGELAERLRLDAPTASRIVAALARQGLVRSGGDPADRRRCRLDLTAKGVTLTGPLRALAQETRAGIVADLSASEQETLRQMLRKVIANLSRLEHRVTEGAA